MTEYWYPESEDYYDTAANGDIPVRQGDLLISGSTCLDSKGRKWHGCIVVHPSCDVVTGKVDHIQVCRVRLLTDQSRKYQELIVVGERTDEQGRNLVAMAHTYYMAPVADHEQFGQPMYADLLDVVRLPKHEVTVENRIAALTHDARNCFIRRSLYWRQRWLLPASTVQQLEAHRISHDSEFQGPRPSWASTARE